MNEEEHILSCLAEECNEIGKNVSKALRFGLSDWGPGKSLNNAQAIRYEFLDLVAVMELLISRGILERTSEVDEGLAKQAKKEKVLQYIEVAKKLGTIT